MGHSSRSETAAPETARLDHAGGVFGPTKDQATRN